MTRAQYFGIVLIGLLVTCLAVSAYLLSHRYQTAASNDFLYVVDTFTGDISAYLVAREGQTFDSLRVHEVGQK